MAIANLALSSVYIYPQNSHLWIVVSSLPEQAEAAHAFDVWVMMLFVRGKKPLSLYIANKCTQVEER